MLKFSVIVPVYNSAEYLEECISSALQQTYPLFELILVDDGSTDTSAEICDRYESVYPGKVIVVHRENKGQFHARIFGIQIAKGDVVCFLDSDDTLRIDALEKIADAFKTFKCDMVLFEAQECNAFLSQPLSLSLCEGTVFTGETKKTLYRKLIESQELNNIYLKAIRREYVIVPTCFESLGKLRHGEDLLLSAQFITAAPRVVFLKQGLYHYRIRWGSVTHSFSQQRLESINTVHDILEWYIDFWDMPELTAALNTRKVNGYVTTLRSLLKNRHIMSKVELRSKIQSLMKTPDFLAAYRKMDGSRLRMSYRIFAFCLYHKWYVLLLVLAKTKELLSNLKHHFVRKK